MAQKTGRTRTETKSRKRTASPARSVDPPMNPDDPYCFLVTPFAEDQGWLLARKEGINPATRRFGFPAYRIDEIPAADAVVDATRRHIANADFVIADLSGARPNCYYEVGYAHALGRPVIHIIRADEQPQFNVAGLRFVTYRNPDHLRQELERHILTHVLTTHGPGDDPDDNKGRFGRRSFVDPYVVTGRVRSDPSAGTGTLRFLIDLRVRSVDRKKPVRGRVTFHMYGDFETRKQWVDVPKGDRAGAYLTGIPTLGTFTVGVTLGHPPVNLEIDLSSLPGAGTEFRNR